MKATEYIRNTIDRLPKGYVFTYEDFCIGVNKKEAIIKALNRMVNSGKIEKLSKGRYFKPEKTPFGTLQPNQEQIVKDLIHENGKVMGYLTGYSIYNKLGLTTQVSNIIQIGKNQTRPKFKRERYTISFVKQKNIIIKKNIHLLQILDSIKYIKKIPDTTIKASCLRFLEIVRTLTLDDKKELIRLAETLNLKNIYFEKPIPKFNVHKVLSYSDSLILAMNNLPSLYKYGISFNKIFDKKGD